MPSGWREIKLGDVTEIVRGSSPRPKGDPRYYGGTVPRLMVEDITRDGKYVTPKVDFLTEDGAKLSRPMKKGDLVVVCSGTVGVPSLLAVDACIHDGFLGFREIDKSIDKEFLYYLFLSLRNKFESSATHGGIFTNLTTTGVKELLFTLPPKNEQEKIAKILSTWDKAIERIESAIKEKSRKKTYVLEHSFQGIRAKKHFKSLDELADIFPSNVDKKSHEGENPVRLCNYVDVYKNHKITAQLNFMEATATATEIQKFTVRKNDVIITKDSETPQDIAIPTFVAEDIKDLVCGYHLTLIRCDSSQILGHYLYYYFLTARSKYYFFTMANGATRFGLSLDSIKECEIPIVDVTEQKKLVFALEAIEHEIELLEKYRATLQTQKQGLMQQLLTGKKRVKV